MYVSSANKVAAATVVVHYEPKPAAPAA
jgi:hypothetical protein